ncbi:hypothetical protein Xekj_03135 [Xenorhabdus sp. KJ12.1]|nr:hypothetical protein Xekj_03135 [Xenorhabdus sp. KJ12.1]
MSLTPLLQRVESLSDPRQQSKCSHLLSEVVFMTLCAMTCGFNTWDEIALFSQERESWFKRWLTLPNGIPAHDTFNRIFTILPPETLQHLYQDWINDILDSESLSGQIAVDGKALRATAKGRGANRVHTVNVWSTELGLCLGQQKVDKKSNEIKAIPEILQQLELTGCSVSLDAAGTQTKIAETILAKSADYLLAVKGNQPTLSAEITAQFAAFWHDTPEDNAGLGFCETFDTAHGRKEHRRCWQLSVDEHMPVCQKWQAKTIIAVQLERVVKGKGHDSVRFFISSQPMNAEQALKATRQHWAVENQLHWVLQLIQNLFQS